MRAAYRAWGGANGHPYAFQTGQDVEGRPSRTTLHHGDTMHKQNYCPHDLVGFLGARKSGDTAPAEKRPNNSVKSLQARCGAAYRAFLFFIFIFYAVLAVYVSRSGDSGDKSL
jgi:hypothetical protein